LRIALLAALAWGTCSSSGMAATLHVDDFQSGTTLGWQGSSFSPPTWQSTGGPMGDGDGYLRVPSGTNLASHNSLEDWTGDYANIGAASIEVDLRNATGSQPLAMRLVLFGPGSLNDRWTSTVSQTVPADGIWRPYEFSLAEDALTWVGLFGSPSYQALMSSVLRVMLRHDPGTPSFGGSGVSATLGIDNIRLVGAAQPVPGDYNGDQLVDQADYEAWRAAFGSNEAAADGNQNGIVDAADYTIWRDNLTVSGGAARAVPEPRLLELCGLAAISACYLARRHGSGRGGRCV